MGNKRVLVPAEEVDLSLVKYEPQVIPARHLTGWMFKLFVKMLEMPVIGPFMVSNMHKQMLPLLRNTVIPEPPMYRPQFPPQEREEGVVTVDEDGKPVERVGVALNCLPQYDPASRWNSDHLASSFRYWKIRDYAHAYRSKFVTPSMVAEHVISVIKELGKKQPPMPLLISFDEEDLRKQAAASTKRFEQGNPISILDGIFMAIKDDIDCYPHPTKDGTAWLHEVHPLEKEAAAVSRLRSCGVIFVGKANLHELGFGITGSNTTYGTPRNPHAEDRYTGGSSSAPAAIVTHGICSAALGTDGGGSIRIPSSLCGVVGLKTTHGRLDMEGVLSEHVAVAVVGPIASSVEDVMLVYAAIVGSSAADRISLNPSPPCLPNLASYESTDALGSIRLGKYTEWFNDVFSTDVSDKCGDILDLLSKTHGCKSVEIVIPELQELKAAHLVSMAEAVCSLIPHFEEAGNQVSYQTRHSVAFFQGFTASDFVASACLRRRCMHHFMEIFKKVDVIVTPTTGMTAPIIPASALMYGEINIQATAFGVFPHRYMTNEWPHHTMVSAYLMRFVVAANFLGFPAITVPVGYDKQGLPVGLQIMGRPWAEATILRVAAAVEELCVDSRKQPASYYNVLK
ncbi:hypothetical protein Tsubulata_036321 [Turnera subulata]|uniref:Amidase domain-containing protein n=1 Tax=Turnera subulata TaxID=218843 RepID=A0A9Q0FGE6_9ROSI|nr:hypothetical protein Tsubulata_036321 [Turnera subulata]